MFFVNDYKNNEILNELKTRVVEIDGVKNVRDIGGILSKDEKFILRKNLLYRSSLVTGITKKGEEQLHSKNIKYIIDLRNSGEFLKDGIKNIPNTIRMVEPGFGMNVLNDKIQIPLRPNGKPWGSLDVGYARLYAFILDEGRNSFKNIFKHIIKSYDEGNSILIHCTSGKDRTGIVSMLIQLLANIDDMHIAFDYYLTEVLQPPTVEYMKKARPPHKAFDNLSDNELVTLARSIPETMLLTIDILRRQYKNVEGYLLSIGLTYDEINRLKEILMVPNNNNKQRQLQQEKTSHNKRNNTSSKL